MTDYETRRKQYSWPVEGLEQALMAVSLPLQLVMVPRITLESTAAIAESTFAGTHYTPREGESVIVDPGTYFHTWDVSTHEARLENPCPEYLNKLADEIRSWTNPYQAWRGVFISWGAMDKKRSNVALSGKQPTDADRSSMNHFFVFKFRSPNPPVTRGKLRLPNVFMENRFPGQMFWEEDATKAILSPRYIGPLCPIQFPQIPVAERLHFYGVESRSTYPQKGEKIGNQSNKPYELMVWIFMHDIHDYLEQIKKKANDLQKDIEQRSGIKPTVHEGLPNW